MSRNVRLLLLWVLALCAWNLLALWIVNNCERFYVLIPPVFACLFLLLHRNPRAELARQGRSLAVFLAMLPILCCLMVFAFAGPRWFLTFHNLLQVWQVSYFLLAVLILAFVLRATLKKACVYLGERLPAGSTGRMLVLQVAPSLLFILVFVPYLMAISYVFHFKVPVTGTPQTEYQRSFEELKLTTCDGMQLQAWYIPAKKPSSTTVIICHGLGINRSVVLPWFQIADTLEANALMFDFRGHGESEGHTASIGFYEKRDVLAAIEYLRSQRPDQARRIIGVGISMGSAALVGAASQIEPPLDGIVIDSGFASAAELADNILHFLPGPARTWLTVPGIPLASLHAGCSLPRHRPEELMGNLRAPVLIIHSENDTLIPIDHARRLLRNAAEPKRLFHAAAPRGHCSVIFDYRDQYLEEVRAMFNSHSQTAAKHGSTEQKR